MFDSDIHAWPLQYADSDACQHAEYWEGGMMNFRDDDFVTSFGEGLIPLFNFTDEPIECLVKIIRKCLVLCVCLRLSPAYMKWWMRGDSRDEWFTSEDSFDSLNIPGECT